MARVDLTHVDACVVADAAGWQEEERIEARGIGLE
jgi:hypothetical protein